MRYESEEYIGHGDSLVGALLSAMGGEPTMTKWKMREALMKSDLSPTCKLVWLCYWSHMNDVRVAWPGNETIQTWSSSSKSSVIRARNHLISTGWLALTTTRKGGRAKSGRYRVKVGRLETKERVSTCDLKGVNLTLNGVTVTTELFHELSSEHIKESQPMSDVNKSTSKEVFAQFNAIRRQHAPDGRELSFKTWKKPFERALKEAPDAQHLLDAWTLFWTEPCFEWNRTVPANKVAYFLRAKNLPQWFDAVDAVRHSKKTIGAVAKLKVDTSTIGLATTFWMRNRVEAEAARNEGDEAFAAYLDENVTLPGNVVALLRRQA